MASVIAILPKDFTVLMGIPRTLRAKTYISNTSLGRGLENEQYRKVLNKKANLPPYSTSTLTFSGNLLNHVNFQRYTSTHTFPPLNTTSPKVHTAICFFSPRGLLNRWVQIGWRWYCSSLSLLQFTFQHQDSKIIFFLFYGTSLKLIGAWVMLIYTWWWELRLKKGFWGNSHYSFQKSLQAVADFSQLPTHSGSNFQSSFLETDDLFKTVHSPVQFQGPSQYHKNRVE